MELKFDICSRIRVVTGSITNSTKQQARKFPKDGNKYLLPLVISTEIGIIKKVATPIDYTKKSRWSLHPEFQTISITNLNDAEILLQIRSILSGGAVSSSAISRFNASRMAEFVAHALPESFALRKKEMLQLIGLTNFLDGTICEERFGLVEMRVGLEIVGQDEVVRLLRAANSDPRAMEHLRMRLGDVRRS